MKAITKRFGNVEILTKSGSIENLTLNIITEAGEKKQLMARFTDFLDESYNKINDFSTIPQEVNINLSKSSSPKKETKLQQLRSASNLKKEDEGLVWDALVSDWVRK